jgi:hypothetical protein
MKILRVIALLLLSTAATWAAAGTCGGGRDLGVMGPPDTELLGNSFSQSGAWVDCYTFEVGSSASSFGLVFDFFDPRIDITSVSLFGGNALIESIKNPLAFSFGALAYGVDYTLKIAGNASAFVTAKAPAGYIGVFNTYAAPVPEPASYVMVLLGLVGLGLVLRRRLR